MVTASITLCNQLGLHARAASKFANTANAYCSEIKVHCNGKTIDGKSILALMLLAASNGTELQLTTSGDDEDTAMEALLDLITNKFGEES